MQIIRAQCSSIVLGDAATIGITKTYTFTLDMRIIVEDLSLVVRPKNLMSNQ